MKSELSGIDIHFLVGEFQQLISGKIDQIYQKGIEEFIFQVHVPNTGKKMIRVIPGNLIYMASAKTEMPQRPPSFCVYLRKYLRGSRIRSIKQLGFERIMEIDLETKNQKYKLILELFSKGNIVVTDEDYLIFSAMENQVWSDRTIKAKETYKYPKREYDFKYLIKDELKELLKKTDRENLVKALAMDLGLGGRYAEGVCASAQVDKDLKPAVISSEQIDSLFEALENLKKRRPRPQQVFKDKEQTDLKDIVPVDVLAYADLTKKLFNSFNEALDDFFTAHESTKSKESATKTITKNLSKIDVMIREQEKRIKGLELSAEDNKKKGEMIFEKYQELTTLLKHIDELRKKHSWKEVKGMLKEYKYIKNIDEAKGEITLEL